MNLGCRRFLTGLVMAIAVLFAASHDAAGASLEHHKLSIRINPLFNSMPLTFDALTNVLASGQSISVTRLDFLISETGLQRDDGRWWQSSNSTAFISARQGRTSFELTDVPAAN